MNCRRCQGLMIRDIAYDLFDTYIHSQVWRCICCGEVLDPLIARNRMMQSLQHAHGTTHLSTATPAPFPLVA